jgi:DNA-binding XRE family transcriptional regulator
MILKIVSGKSQEESVICFAFSGGQSWHVQWVARTSGKIFGQTICKLRAEANLTQEKLAEKADISRRYLQLIEAGRYVPTIEVASIYKNEADCGSLDCIGFPSNMRALHVLDNGDSQDFVPDGLIVNSFADGK